MSALELLKSPHRLVGHQSSAASDATAMFVRSTEEEWACLQIAADQYGAPIGQFAADAILTWLDPRLDIPRTLLMPPLNNLKKRVHLDRSVIAKIKESALTDVRGRPIKVSQSDIGMSAILSFVQGMFDMRTGINKSLYPVGFTVSDAARPSMSVDVKAQALQTG